MLPVISNNNIPLHSVSRGLSRHQMVYKVCFTPKTKVIIFNIKIILNNGRFILVTFQCKFIHIPTP